MDLRLFDIRSYLTARGVKHSGVGKNVSSGWLGLRCLWCGDHSNHLGINLKTKRGKCWKCGRRVAATNVVMAIEGCDFVEAEKVMSQFLDLTSPLLKSQKFLQRPTSLQLPQDATAEFPAIHHQYLLDRNFVPEDIIRRYSLRAVWNLGRWKFRIIIPIIMDHQLIAFTSRDVTGKAELRYKAISDDEALRPSTHWVYNIDTVQTKALLVEGPTDVWRMGEGAICFLGTEDTPAKVLELKRSGVTEVAVLFDAEEEAQQRAEKICFNLNSLGISTDQYFLEQGDPAQLSQEEADEVKREIFGG